MNILDTSTGATNLPRIGADNLFRRGVITASAGTGRYAVDWRADRVWAPGDGTQTIEVEVGVAESVNYLFAAFHNFDVEETTIALQRWTGSTWATVVAAITATDNEPIWRSFNAQSSTKWTTSA